MKQLIAFTKKELTEQWRSGKITILGIIFLLFGVMNPAVAKLTPWMMELMADQLAEQGLAVGEVTVNAMTSWGQYYKNVPMALLIFAVLSAGILTTEYQKGTLINMLTKGLSRTTVLAAKGVTLLLEWSVAYWMLYGVTYIYTVFFWDNSIVKQNGAGALLLYLAGILLIALILLFSTIFTTGTAVIGAVGGCVILSYLLGMIPTLTKYLPTYLLSAGNLLTDAVKVSEFVPALLISAGIVIGAGFVGTIVFNKKML